MKKINIDVKQQAIIYVVQNKLNGKKYIGYSSNGLEHVMSQHQNKYNKSYAGKSKLFKAMRENGIESFVYRVLSIVTYYEKEQLLKAVEKTKQIHQTETNGYN